MDRLLAKHPGQSRRKGGEFKGNLLSIHLELTKWEEKQISNIRTGAMLAYISRWDIFFSLLSFWPNQQTYSYS